MTETIEHCLNEHGLKHFTLSHIRSTEQAGIAKAIDRKSVVLVHYKDDSQHLKNMNHWVCCVAANSIENRIYVACSVILQKIFMYYENYEEMHHEHVQR